MHFTDDMYLLLESGSDGAGAPGEGPDQLTCFDRTCEIAGEDGGGKIFTFERLRHFVLNHFNLSYEASQSGRQQPATHTRVARRFCCSRIYIYIYIYFPGSPYGGAIFLFDTPHDHADRRLFSSK
jgi:hypothetical protein